MDFPIYVTHQDGVTSLQLEAVLSGIHTVLDLARASCEVTSFGVWRDKNWLNGEGVVTAYNSVDWYIGMGRHGSDRRRQLNVDRMMQHLRDDPLAITNPHYDVMIVHSDIYAPGTRFVIGMACPGRATVISVNRFAQMDAGLQSACIETETMHEVGHVFGLVPDSRILYVEENLGRHCTKKCVMRQGVHVPSDWIRFSQERMHDDPFCEYCRHDLQDFFHR